MTDDQEFFEELRKDFLDEASYLLEQCEESYLKLESPACRPEELAKIFRLAHSMKGGGTAVGFHDLAAFAHIVEDCLSVLRANPDAVNPGVISVLLQAGDAFKARIRMLKVADPTVWETAKLESEIKAIISTVQGSPALEQWKELSDLTKATLEPAPAAKTSAAAVDDPFPMDGVAQEAPVQENAVEDCVAHVEATVVATIVPAQVVSTAVTTATAATTNAAQPAGSIKIDAERVENVLNIVGELVVIKSQLMNQCSQYSQDLRLAAVVSLMDRTVRDLQDKTLSMRMTPLRGLFLKTQRIIRDLSLKLGKPVDFKMSGDETELDRTIVELLADPLMHIVRNSLDHGIESAEKRSERKKDGKGVIHVSARQQGSRVVIVIEDDGNGVNRENVLAKARERGLLPADRDASQLSDREVNAFLFMPGFSTAAQVTDVSGRGVGMDVVKTNIERLKGNIDIDSRPGLGTSITISIPLTTSITDGMVIEVSGYSYILPMDSIQELTSLNEKDLVEMRPGEKILHYRDRVLPIFELANILASVHGDEKRGDGKMIAIIHAGAHPVALRLDRVLGQTQVVLKPLSAEFDGLSGIAGVAILGDGKVALVLDPASLVCKVEPSNSKSTTGLAA